MFWSVLGLLLVAVFAVALIHDGYKKNPSLGRGSGGMGRPMSVLSRWILGPYLVLLALVVIPGFRGYLPENLQLTIFFGFIPVWAVMLLGDLNPFKWRPFGRSRKRSVTLSSSEQRQLRRERKEQRLRRAGGRRHD